jgi:hypothetical protein
METFAMSDTLKVVNVKGTSYVSGRTVISPTGKAGGNTTTTNFQPYVLPGQDFEPKDDKIETPEFIIAARDGFSQPVTSNKWWSPALLQHASHRPREDGWVLDADIRSRRSRPMVNEPFRIDFVDMTNPDWPAKGYPPELLPIGLRFWNQSDMYVFTGDDKGDVDDNKFSIDNLAQSDAPIVTVGLQGVHPLANLAAGKLSNVVVNDYSVFHVEMAYADSGSELNIQVASGVPYVVLRRTKGSAPFQLWAGSPVTDVGSNPNKDTYATFKTRSSSELGFKLGMRFLPALPDGVKPPLVWGTAGYYVRADRGEWVLQSARYGTQSYFTWVNKEATTVWLFAMPHNVDLDNAAAVQAAIDTIMAAPAMGFGSDVLYPPQYSGQMDVNGQAAAIGYDGDKSKITVGYRWRRSSGDPTPLFLALFPHHRRYMRGHDRECFPMDGNRPKYLYRTLKGEMWLYHGSEFVRELDVHGLLPFQDIWWTTNLGAESSAYAAMRSWFWQQEPTPGPGSPDSFAWNYFENGGPEANPYVYGWAGIYENLVIADQLAQGDNGGFIDRSGHPQMTDPDFKTIKRRVAEVMRDKILDVMKQLFHQWFDVYSAQCLQYNDKFQTVCGYPEGYFCVSHLCDHHFHWGYFLRAAAAIGRHDPAWLDQHWAGIELLIRDSANYDRKDTRFPQFRNFSPFYGHCWANGIAINNGQDQESTSEALNFAFGMIELATLRGDATMLAVGLWLYEEQVCAAEQYWFNVDADLYNDPPADRYYNGNWPKDFVRFKRGGEIWNSTIIGILAQQSVTRHTHFGSVQGTYSIHMTPIGACSLYLDRHPDWLEKTYKTYLQTIHTMPDQRWTYENVIAAWQAGLARQDDRNLPQFEQPGTVGAGARVSKVHNKYPGALNSQVMAWLGFRQERQRQDSSFRSNAVHFAVMNSMQGDKPSRTYIVYNPSSQDMKGVKFWQYGQLMHTVDLVAPRSMQTYTRSFIDGSWSAGIGYTPALYKPPQRLYLRSGGRLDAQPGPVQQPDGEVPYPMDLSDADLKKGIIKLPYGDKNPLVFTGSFAGKLKSDFAYTQFSFFTNAALWPGWTRDEMHNVGAGVEVKIEYDFGYSNITRTEFYGPSSKFNLQTNNTWLNHNALTEFATTTVPLRRDSKQNPLTPKVEGADFAAVQQVSKGTIKVSIYANNDSRLKPDIYLSYDCTLASHRASWIKVPYE